MKGAAADPASAVDVVSACCAMAACAKHRANGVRANRLAFLADGCEDKRRQVSEGRGERGNAALEGREHMAVLIARKANKR